MKFQVVIFSYFLSLCVYAASPVDIHFHGKIIDASCQIDSESVSRTIDLGTIYNKNLSNPGEASDWMAADILLINCPVSTVTATATFSGTPSDEDVNLYKNLEDAQNVAIELQDRDRQTELGNGAVYPSSVDDSGRAIFHLKARAKTVNGNATPGTIRSIIEITYTYQ